MMLSQTQKAVTEDAIDWRETTLTPHREVSTSIFSAWSDGRNIGDTWQAYYSFTEAPLTCAAGPVGLYSQTVTRKWPTIA